LLTVGELLSELTRLPDDTSTLPPLLQGPLPDVTANEDESFRTWLSDMFSDAQGQSLSFSAELANGEALPEWMHVDAETGVLSGTPGNDQVGTWAVTVTATNAAGQTTADTFNLTVANVNDAPQVLIPPEGSVIVEEGTAYVQNIDWFHDVDAGDALSLSVATADGSPLPAWVQFDVASRSLLATPPLGALGAITVRITATDMAGLSVTNDLVIDVHAGSAVGEVLVGGPGNDTLQGGLGNDTLRGGDGDDTLDGGAGADTLYAGTGNNTYMFGRGNGEDRVHLEVDTTGSVSTLQFEAGVDPSQVRLSRAFDSDVAEDNGALEVSIVGTTDKITFNGFFLSAGPNNALNPLQQIRFADGTTWDLSAILERAFTGTDGNDTLIGLPVADIMNGGAGNDSLRGGSGNDTLQGGLDDDVLRGNEGDDTLDGGAGADNLYAGTGNNTYLFGRGDGQDRVHFDSETQGMVNTLQFKAGVDPSQVHLSRVQENDFGAELGALEVSIAGTTDKITFNFFFGNDTPENAYNPLQQIRFADGTTWDLSAILERTFTGTDGDDTLIGLPVADIMNGGAGNDTLVGGAGADTYLFARGDGQDVIQDNDSTSGVLDRVQFAAGIVQADLSFSQVDNNLEALINGGTDKLIVQDWYVGSQWHVEEFRFNDGSVLTDSQVQGLVSAMAGFNAPASGETTSTTVWRGTSPENLAANALM